MAITTRRNACRGKLIAFLVVFAVLTRCQPGPTEVQIGQNIKIEEVIQNAESPYERRQEHELGRKMSDPVHFYRVEVQVPPGRYYLGDPSYVINAKEDWMYLLESCGYFGAKRNAKNSGHVGSLPNGVQVLAFSTKYGDGVYLGSDGRQYGVDSGLIGLVPEAAVDKGATVGGWLGRWIEFDRPTICKAHENGDLEFGTVLIETR